VRFQAWIKRWREKYVVFIEPRQHYCVGGRIELDEPGCDGVLLDVREYHGGEL